MKTTSILRLVCCLGVGVLVMLSGGCTKQSETVRIQTFPRFPMPRDIFPIIAPYLPKDPAILEGGAYDGNNTAELASLWPKGMVYSFEPVPALYQNVKARTAALSNVHVYDLALSDKVGTATFHVSEFDFKPGVPSESSSLLAPKRHKTDIPNILFKKDITVATTTIDDWASKNGVDRIDFLYLDIQGAELMAMKGAPRIMKTVKVIMTELESVELYEGQGQYPELKQWLEAQGFRMIATNFDPAKGDPWAGDAVFARE